MFDRRIDRHPPKRPARTFDRRGKRELVLGAPAMTPGVPYGKRIEMQYVSSVARLTLLCFVFLWKWQEEQQHGEI